MAGFFARRRLHAFGKAIEAARRGLALEEAKALLDVGGGDGWLTAELARGIARVAVVEPRESARSKGAKRHPAIEFVDGVAERLPFPDAAFDRVVATGSFHHFDDPQAGLAELRRVLAPGGRVMIFEFSPEKGKGRFLVRFACHHALKTPAELRALVEKAGFHAVESVDATPGYVVFGRV